MQPSSPSIYGRRRNAWNFMTERQQEWGRLDNQINEKSTLPLAGAEPDPQDEPGRARNGELIELRNPYGIHTQRDPGAAQRVFMRKPPPFHRKI